MKIAITWATEAREAAWTALVFHTLGETEAKW